MPRCTCIPYTSPEEVVFQNSTLLSVSYKWFPAVSLLSLLCVQSSNSSYHQAPAAAPTFVGALPNIEPPTHQAKATMHFSKTYSKLLLDLPPELRENAIQYRQVSRFLFFNLFQLILSQLKKLINQVVSELNTLGLRPDVLHDLLESRNVVEERGKEKEEGSEVHPSVVYEFNSSSGKIEPRLRLWITSPLPGVPASDIIPSDSEASSDAGTDIEPLAGLEHPGAKNISLLWALHRKAAVQDWEDGSPQIREVTEYVTSDLDYAPHLIS